MARHEEAILDDDGGICFDVTAESGSWIRDDASYGICYVLAEVNVMW